MANSYDDNANVESTIYDDLGSTPKVTPVEKVSEVTEVGGVNSFGAKPNITSTKEYNYQSKQQEDAAQNEAQLQFTTGVERVRDSEEAKEWVSAKQLYEKTLGVTEYDELRAKLNLRSDESFTDYYNRTHYVPKGFEMQAQLLLAEEKRKKLYSEVQAGNMSEEDFLYEAYGKDLLKEEGVDFSSSLYWYNRYKNGDYSDPRKNSTYMLQVIENARTLFESETWFKESRQADLASMCEGLVTGEELPAETIQELFSEQFKELDQYYDNAEKIVKLYRGGMLQGFNPTIDANGDGKIDYYLAPDGKLYNVNETGEGANTYKAYYNSDGSLNRIVSSDSVIGEFTGEFLKSIGRFFTGVIDLGTLVVGAVADIIDGGKFGDTLSSIYAGEQSWLNSTILGNKDLVVDNGFTKQDGSLNLVGIGRQVSSLAGTVASFILTSGISTAITTSGKIATMAATEIPKGLAGSTAKILSKIGAQKIFTKGIGKAVKWGAKTAVSTALQLTSWSNGAFGSGLGARAGTALMLASRDCLQSVATLATNQKKLGLSDSEVVTHALGGAAINFSASLILRQVVDQGAMTSWAKFANKIGTIKNDTIKGAIANNTAPNLFTRILSGTMTAKDKIGVGIANTVMDQIENTLTAWTQSSLSSSGKVLDWDSLKGLWTSPQFIFNSLYQAGMSFKDELRISKNTIIGATADAVQMDQEFRAYIAKCKSQLKPEEVSALDAMIVEYDKAIKNKMNETNNVTGAKFTRAEATLSALDEAVTKLDLDQNNEFIQKQAKRFNKYVSDTKRLYAEAVFTSANNSYKAYTDLSKDAWSLKADFLYGKETKDLIEDYNKYMQKYFAIPIDKQLYYDVYNTDYMSYITKQIRKYKEDADINDDDYKIVAGVEKTEVNKDGKFETQYTIKNCNSEIAINNYKAQIVDKFGIEGRTNDIFIIANNIGDSEGQKRIAKSNPLLDTTAEVEEQISGINSDIMPFLVKLDNGVYVIPNLGGLGDQFSKITNISAVFNCLRLIRYNYENSKSMKQHFLDIVGINYNKDISNLDIEEQKKYYREIRATLNALCGEGKALNDADAIRIINALKAEGLDILSVIDKDENNYSHLMSLIQLSKMNDSYEKAKDSLSILSKDDSNKLPDKIKMEHANNIREFQSDYLNNTDNQLLIKGEKYGLFNPITIKNISNIPFVKDLQEGIATKQILETMRAIANNKNTVDAETKKALIETFLDKLGYTSEPISNNEVESEIIDTIQKQLVDLYLIRDENTGYTYLKYDNDIASTRELIGSQESIITETIDKVANTIEKYKDSKDPKVLQKAINKVNTLTNKLNKLFGGPKLNDHSLDGEKIFNDIKQIIVDSVVSKYTTDTSKSNKYLDILTSPKSITQDLIKLKTAVQKDYKYTIEDYKNLETMFDNDLALASKIYKNTTNITAKKILVVDLNKVVGDTGYSVLKKFQNDKLLDDFMNSDDASKINQLFPNKGKLNEFKKEMSAIKKLKRTYADDVIYFNIDSPEDEISAKKFLSDIYNYNYAIRNADDIDMPGIYLVSKDTEGIQLKTSLSAIKKIAGDYNNSAITDQRIDLVQDFYNVFESLSSGFTFIDDDTIVKPSSIIITNMNDFDQNDESTSHSLTSSIGYNTYDIDVKLGKIAGAKLKNISLGYTGFGLADNDIDTEITQKYFISKTIDSVEKYWKVKEGDSASAGLVILKPDKKDQAIYEKLYTITKLDNNKVILTPKSTIDFKETAYKLLEQDSTNIKYILGLGSKQESKINSMIGITDSGSTQASQITTGPTPYALMYENMISEFNVKDIQDIIAVLSNNQIHITKDDLDYDKALAYFNNNGKGRTVSDILTDTSEEAQKLQSNIFYQMELRAIKATREVSLKYKNQIPDSIYKLFGDRNFRANLAIAMNDAEVRNLMKFEDNKLILSDKLINKIYEKYQAINNEPNTKDSKTKLSISKDIYTILTGPQTGTLNVERTIKPTAENIKTFLELASLTNISLINTEQTYNPLQTFYSMMLAATGESYNNTSFISLKALHHLSKQDCDIILKELEDKIDSSTYNKLRNTIYLIKTGEEYNNKPLSSEEYINPYIARELKDRKLVSVDNSEGKAINIAGITDKEIADNLSELNSFKARFESAIQSNYTKEKLKLSSIVEHATDNFALKFYKTLAKVKMPNATNKGSILIANMDISSNRSALFLTLAKLTKVFSSDDFGEEINLIEKRKSKHLTKKEAAQLALDLYMYTTGDDYQPSYPQYILYNKRNRKIISTVNSTNSYHNNIDNLITELFLKTNINVGTKIDSYINKTDSNKANSNDIVIISVPRNALESIYTPDINPNIELLTLDDPDELGRSKTKAMIDYSYTNFVNRFKQKNKNDRSTDAELQDAWINSLFDRYSKSAKYQQSITDEAIDKIALNKEVADDIYNSADSYSYTTDSSTAAEHRLNTFLNIKGKPNTLLQKENDAVTYGITDNVFNKISGFKDIINSQKNDIRKELKRALSIKDLTVIDDVVDAFKSNEPDRITLAVTNLKNTVTVNESTLPTITKYIIANLDTVESKMFMLMGRTLDSYKDVSLKDTYEIPISSSKKITIADLRTKTILSGDTESIYNDSSTLAYQAAFDLEDNSGHKKSKVLYLDLKIEGLEQSILSNSIKSGKELAEYLRTHGYETWYKDYYENNRGTQESIDNLYSAYKNGTLYKGEVNPLADLKITEDTYFIGFNNKNYDNDILMDNINDEALHTLIKERSLDLRDLKDQVPTPFQFRNQKNEGTLSGSLESANITNNNAHEGLSDASSTYQLLIKILDSVVETNHYQNKIVDTVDNIVTQLIDNTKLDKRNFKFDVNKDLLSNEDLKLYKKLSKLNNPGAQAVTERLRNILNYYNIRNTISATNMSDIYNIDVRTQIFSSLNKGQVQFANTFNKPKLKAEAKEILSAAIYKYGQAQGKDIKFAKNKVAILLSGNDFANENSIASGLSNVANLKTTLNLSDEDITSYKLNNNIDKYNIETDPDLTSKLEDIIGAREVSFKKSLASKVYYSTKPIQDFINDMFKDYPQFENDNLANYIKDSLNNFFDIDEEAISANNGNKPEANTNALINAISKIDQDSWDQLLQDPFLNKNYKEIYREVTAPPINKKLKLAGSTKEQILRNDTLAITQKQLAKLMGVNNLTEETLRQSLGLTKQDTLYIPVIRHPMDKTDSIHFLKLMIIEDGQGIDIAINADTMKTRFNGDLDGDHIMILKPSKSMEAFANTRDGNSNTLAGLQHNVMDILYNELEKTKFNVIPTSDLTTAHQIIVRDNNLNTKVLDALRSTKNSVYTDYDTAKETFISKLKSSDVEKTLTKYNATLEDFANEVFWSKPFDMTAFNSVENNTRLVTFSDYLGIHDSDLGKENFKDRRRYRFGEISKYGTLALGDSESGTLQKALYNKKVINYDDLQFVENLIRLSGTTKNALNNLSAHNKKVFLKNIIYKCCKDLDLKDLSNLDFASQVEQVLIIKQIKDMSERQKLASIALNNLKENSNKDTDSRFINYYLNKADKDETLPAINFIVNTKKQFKNSYASSVNTNIDNEINALFNLYSGRQPKSSNISDEQKHKELYTPMKVLYIVPNKNSKVKLNDIATEDTILPLHGIDRYVDAKPKVFALNSEDINKLDNKPNGYILSDSDLKMLNLSKDLTGMVRLIDIDKDNKKVLVALTSKLNGQKVVFSGTDATKATISTYANVSGVPEDIKVSCAFVRLFGQDKSKKAYETPFSGKEITYYDKNGNKLKNVNSISDNVAFFTVDEDVNMAEVPKLFNQDVSESKFEELAHANNVDSINGMFLYNGELYNVNEDGISFNNEALIRTKQIIDRANLPDRTEANGYNIYLLLKALVIAKQNNESYDRIQKLFSGGPAMWKHYSDNKYSKKDKSFESVILSKELEDYIIQDTLKRTNMTVTDSNAKEFTSTNRAPTQIEQNSNNITSSFSTGNLTDMNNEKFEFQASHYISKKDLLNKINELMGTQSRLFKTELQKGDALNMFNNGVYKRRTQTSNGPREYYESEVDARYNNNTSDKTGSVYKAENPVYENKSIFPGDILSDDTYTSDIEFTGFTNDKKFFRSNYKDSYTTGDNSKIRALNNLMNIIISKDIKSDIDIAALFSNKYKAKASIKTDYKGFDSKGNLSYSIRPTKINGTTNPTTIGYNKLLTIIKDLGKSSSYYSNRDKFKQEVQLGTPTNPNSKKEVQLNKDFNSSEYNIDLVLDTIKSQEQPVDKIDAIRKSIPTFNTIEEVVKDADQRFYSGSPNGETKIFESEKIKLNQGIKLDSTEAIEADRVIKGMASEANSISMDYDKQLVLLNNIAQRNDSIDEINKFAYVFAAANKIKIIEQELKTSKGTSRSDALKDSLDITKQSIKDMGITDIDKYLKDFGKIHTEEVNILMSILNKLNIEASKYSKLCGEPGQNIFFLLTPSVQNNSKYKKAKSEYIISMLAKGNNPVKFDKDKLGYVATELPTYDSYNLFSSLATSINSISKQAAIYNNSLRLKKLGLMTNASLTTNLIEILESEYINEHINPNKLNKDVEQSFNLYSQGLKDLFKDEPNVIKNITLIENSKHLTVAEKYTEALLLIKGYIDSKGLTLEEASSAEYMNTMPEFNTNEYNKIVTAYNIYADTFAELSWLCDDTIIDEVYNKLINNLDSNKVFVDKFGRKLDDIYAQSENSIEVWFEFLDNNLNDLGSDKSNKNQKRKIINKLLKGELFLMDKTLADTLSTQVFVKKDLNKMQSTLRKVSSFCVSALMSNPFKIIDRFVKFTMFDTATLSTANAKTMLKQPEAFKDLRAYFASKGLVSTNNLDEFMYTQGININHNNFDTIYNNNNSSLGFNPLKTYTDAVGNVFSYQTLATRYAYWLAAKESIAEGDYSVLGSAYYLKDKLKQITGTDRVSKEGQQAAFAMAQNIGAPNDFPSISKSLSNNGMVFTTFPLAAIRWGIGEARSLATIASEMFKGQFNNQSAKWLFRNGGGILGTFIAEQLLITVISNMFGISNEEDDDREEKWKETGALPNITQTLLTGEPIMDTYSSMNITRELKGLTIDPFLKNEDNSSGGISRFFYKNILSHINPIAKNIVEVATNKDLIDDKIIDTKDKYTMFENVARKLSSYIIGSAGANALINSFNNYDSLGDNFTNGLTAAVAAECGNTKTYKSNLKNYYKSLSKLNAYLYSGKTSNYLQDTDTQGAKTEIRKLIQSQPKVTDVYKLIQSLNNKGYDASTIRSAFRSCSIQYKLEQVTDMDDMLDSLSDASYNNIKTAIAFENYMYPWLDEGIDYLDRYIKSNYKSKNNLYYKQAYNRYNNYNNINYTNPVKQTYSNNKYKTDPYDSYTSMQKQQEYNKQQAEYKRRQQQYKENK